MKKVMSALLCAIMILGVTGCGGNTKKEPVDLIGTWVSENNNGSYQEATISNDTIEIEWISPDSKSLYWSGSFINPTDTEDEYVWISNADHTKTDKALLASIEDTKTFTYQDGNISYEASIMGVTKTVKLEKK